MKQGWKGKKIMMHLSIIKTVKENGQAYRRVETKAYQKKDSKLLSGSVCVSADDL